MSFPADWSRQWFVQSPPNYERCYARQKQEKDCNDPEFAHLVEETFGLREPLFNARDVASDVQAIH